MNHTGKNKTDMKSYIHWEVVLETSASELTQGTMGFHFERDGSPYNH